MVFFGTKEYAIQGQVVRGIKCPHCGKDKHVAFGALRYFHISWVPIFPTSKIAGIHCLHCKGVYSGEEFPEKVEKKLNNSLFTKRRVAPAFTGLIILISLLMGGYVAGMAEYRQEAVYLQKTRVNDYYLVNFTKIFEGINNTYKYGIMKVVSINRNEVKLLVSATGYNITSGPIKDIISRRASGRDYYEDSSLVIRADEIKKLKKNGVIYSVERL